MLNSIEHAIYTPIMPLDIEAWITPEPVSFAERRTGQHTILTTGQTWGQLWDCAWFHFTGHVPTQVAGSTIVLLIDISGEACVVDNDGCPALGLTTVSSEFDMSLGRPGKFVVPLTERAQGGEPVDLWADAACNDLFGKYQDSGTIKRAHIAVHNAEMEQLYYDFSVLHELMTQLSPEQARYHRIMTALRRASHELINYTSEEAQNARAILANELAKRGGDASLAISTIGHAHIDLAWLWPIRETIRKGARSFATVLALMDRYPDYIFGASQPQLYQWIKDYYPQLYTKIQARVLQGRWETQGAMWVEPDTNVSGGEALVRQVLYGQRFFREEFGTEPKMLWLPDVFGYTAALPQILKKAGIEYFLTIKLSWNKFNVFPHHTFFWQGLDGSKVLAHMPPEGTYNSAAAPRSIIAAEKNYADKAVSEHCALLFGIGDGGGGPGVEHLERLKRERDLAGLAPVSQEFMETFFQRIAQDTRDYKTWSGELYLETHQGTYTSQARNKRFNRKMEFALRELEFVSTLAMLKGELDYPGAELTAIWKEVLLYQFHDILPGSSITRVYTESLERYHYLLTQTQELFERALDSLITTRQEDSAVTIFNTLSWERHEWVRVHDRWCYVQVPALGYTTLDAVSTNDEARLTDIPLQAAADVLENDRLRLQFAPDGSLYSLFDKEQQREVLEPEMCANRLAVYHDDGDAWDFSITYSERPPQYFVLEKTSAYLDGPQAVLEQHYCFGKSTLQQRIVLTANSRRIDFVTSVDWHERNKMLRTSFPVSLRSSEVTCDIQFGSIKRPTHHNTQWDMARYEICAHKWVDLSQWDYGVALLNDCKYGYKVTENVLDLNLLRSPGYPDPQADLAQHEFTYALYPHAGNHITGSVVRAGYELNVPLRTIAGRAEVPTLSFVQCEAENVIVEAVKKAEDSADIVLRLYEATGARTRTTLEFESTISAIWQTNLMEEREAELKHQGEKVEIALGPFEIITVCVHRD